MISATPSTRYVGERTAPALHARVVPLAEEFLRAKAEEWAAQRQTRIDLRGGAESDNESAYTLVEEVDEVELDFKEEVVDYGGRRDSD